MNINNSWLQHFSKFSAAHLCVVLAFVTLMTLIIQTRRFFAESDRPLRALHLDKAIGFLALAIAVWIQFVTLSPSNFDYRTSLPLHVCNLTTFIAPAALLLRWRPLRVITYFWGLGLCSYAFILPDLSLGPAHIEFWTFWCGHAAIVGLAIYDFAAVGFRPNWRDWKLAVGFSISYLVIMFLIDFRFNLNYGYIGRSLPWQHTTVEAFGPWPWRVLVIFLLAMATMLLLVLPWEVRQRINSQEKLGAIATDPTPN